MSQLLPNFSDLGFDDNLNRGEGFQTGDVELAAGSIGGGSIASGGGGGSPNGTENIVEEQIQPDEIASGDMAENLVIVRGGSIKSGATDYNEGDGWWLGRRTVEDDAAFFIGDSDGDKLTYNPVDGLVIIGSITATSGTIGGWTINATTITGGNATLGSTGVLTLGTGDDVVIASAVDATYRLWVGDATATDAPFRVDKDGNMTAASVSTTVTHSVQGTIVGQSNIVAGETIAAGDAVYVSTTDGKVYLTDASDTSKIDSFIGIAVTGGATDATILVQEVGIVTGLSGLVAGTKYYLASAASNPSINTAENGANVSLFSGTSGDSDAFGMLYTTTTPGKLSSITLSVTKINSGGEPSDLILDILAGTPDGDNPYGTMGLLATVTVAAASIGTTEQDVVFTFTTPLVLAPGTYTVLVHQATGACTGTRTYDIESSATATGTAYYKNRWLILTTTWTTAGATRFAATFGWEAITKTAGDIHEYFFSHARFVGIGVSTTALHLFNDQTRYAQGRIAVSAESPTTVTTNFAPQMIIMSAITKYTNTGPLPSSFGVATRSGQGCIYNEVDNSGFAQVGADAQRIMRSWHNTTGSEVGNGNLGGVSFTTTGFIFGPSDILGNNAQIQWAAWG